MRALEISSGKTSAELEKMLEQGKLTSEYIMPMVMAMGQLAEANGAYEKALVKLGTVENRMKTSAGLAAARIGEAGFTEGLIKLYEGLMDVFNENEHALKELGKAFNVIFRVIKKGIEFITPAVAAFSRTLGSLARVIEYMAVNPTKAMELGFYGALAALALLIKKIPDIKKLGMVLTGAFRSPLFILTMIVGLMDEIRAYFDDNVIGLFDDENMSEKESAKLHAQRRLGTPFERKGDKELAGGGVAAVPSALQNDVYNALGGKDNILASPLAFAASSIADMGAAIRNSIAAGITSAFDRIGASATGYFNTSLSNGMFPAPASTTVVIPVMLDGREISKQVVKDVNKQQQTQMSTSLPAGGQ